MRTYQENRVASNNNIGFFQLRTSSSDCLDLPALQHKPCLESLFDEVVVKGFSVFKNGHGENAGKRERLRGCRTQGL